MLKLHPQTWHFAIASRLQNWRSSTGLMHDRLLGIVAVILLALLPYLENAQTGVISVVVTALWLILWLTETVLPQQPLVLPLFAYWLVAIVSVIFSPVRMAALDGLIKLSLYFGVFLALAHLMGRGWRSILLGTYLGTTLIVAGYGIHQSILGAQELATWTDPTSELAGITRIYSFLGNPNLLAGYFLPAIPLGLVASWRWTSLGAKILALVVAMTCLYGVLQTYSRGALLGLVAIGCTFILLLIFWWGRKLPTWTLPAFLGGASLVSLGGLLVIPTIRSRIFSIFLGTGDSSNAFRLNVWLSVVRMIQAYPLLGIGPGNRAFNLVYPLYQRSNFSALGTYSVPLEITVETGIIGLLVYGWLLWTGLRQAWQKLLALRLDRNGEGLWIIGSLSAMAGLMGQGLFDTVWFRPQVQILWWLCMAILCPLNPSPSIAPKVSVDSRE